MAKETDLELIKQLEKEIGVELELVPLKKIGTKPMNAFAADNEGQVKGLSICGVKLKRVPAVLPKLRRLEKLVLHKTQISDISSLKELKNVKKLDLRKNKVTQLPVELLGLGLEIKWEWDTDKEGIYL